MQPMDLIQRSQSGDQEAFAALFEQYKNLVYKTAYLILDHNEEAEDALQEVFIQLHDALSTFDPAKGAFTTWLYRITVNHCHNRLRQQRPVQPLADLPPSLLADAAPPLEKQLAEQTVMQQALGRLSPKLRTTVILRYYADLSYAEIADVLGIPIGTVRSRLHQAIKQLGEMLVPETTAVTGQEVTP
jgi:RNA polymerase sigma-70 factor, ECF subfamily